MASIIILGLCVLFTLFLLPTQAADSFQEACLAFKPETFAPNSTREVVSYVPAGTTLTFPDNVASCARPSQVVGVDLCRVALSIPTSNRSSVTFEQWLPRNWTGRFLATGNAGIDGCEWTLMLYLGLAALLNMCPARKEQMS